MPDEILATYTPGNVVTERAFTSTAAVPDAAFGGRVRMTVEGTSGRNVAMLSEFPDEAEILYALGARFEVISRTTDPATGQIDILMREVPADNVVNDVTTSTTRRTTTSAGSEAVEETTERGVREGGGELTEASTERSARQADDMPDFSEKLRVAALAKVTSDALEWQGVPAPGIVRALASMYKPQYPWIKRFEYEIVGTGRAIIYMIASKIRVDDVRQDLQQAHQSLNADPNGSLVQRLDEADDAYRSCLVREQAELDEALDSMSYQGRAITTEAEWDALYTRQQEAQRRIDRFDNSRASMAQSAPTDDWADLPTLPGGRQPTTAAGAPRNPTNFSDQDIDNLITYYERQYGDDARERLSWLQAEKARRTELNDTILPLIDQVGRHSDSAKLLADALNRVKKGSTHVAVPSRAKADELYRLLDEAAEQGGGQLNMTRIAPKDRPVGLDQKFRGPEMHLGADNGTSRPHYNADLQIDGQQYNIHIYWKE